MAWLTMGAAQRYMGVRAEKFRELVFSGEIPSSFLPDRRGRRVDTADIDDYMRRHRFWTPKSRIEKRTA